MISIDPKLLLLFDKNDDASSTDSFHQIIILASSSLET